MAGAGMRERVDRMDINTGTGGREHGDARGHSKGGSGEVTRSSAGAANGGVSSSTLGGVGGPREEWKRGNEAFSQSLYSKAIEHYSNAVKQDPLNHILYSNRSAAYASLRMWDKAIADGNECVRLRPDWAKGYCRLGAAFEGKNDLTSAEKAYTDGLEREPENALLQISLFRVCGAEQGSIDHLQSTGASAAGNDARGRSQQVPHHTCAACTQAPGLCLPRLRKVPCSR